MIHNYVFKRAYLKCGERKSLPVTVQLMIDIEDDDPFGPPPKPGYYQNGFVCKGELTFEWPTSVPLYFKKMLEGHLSLYDGEDGSFGTGLKIIFMSMLDSAPGMAGALPGQPCRTKHYTWSFISTEKPLADALGLFPDVIKRQVMKVFVFTGFTSFWNRSGTAIVAAETRQKAIELVDIKLKEKGIAPLTKNGYSILELDPTKSDVIIVTDD